MPTLLPSSHAVKFRLRLAPIDVVWAALAPPIALYLRDAQVLSVQGAPTALFYCSLSFVFTLIGFLAFRVGHGVARYFSVHDAVNIIKAAGSAGLTTTVVIFTFTRLDGVPRSMPVLQVLVLAAGLLATRAIMALLDKGDDEAAVDDHSAVEHIIMIGSSRLTALYIKLLQAHVPAQRQVIAILDDNPKRLGRTMFGVPVIAGPSKLELVIEEFAIHGIRTDRVIVGGDEALLAAAALNELRNVCAQRDMTLSFVPNLIGLEPLPAGSQTAPRRLREVAVPTAYALSSYLRYKRVIDIIIAGLAIVALSPFFLLASILVLFDLGAPLVFWQKRLGQNGKSFLLYKFRTLHAPFDRNGQPTGTIEYSSWIGRLLRRMRFDELPQLFNVLVGDMSLIGPRPLLLEDQPTNCHLRLLVRPGITGWAQINGGNLVTTEEKGALDDWYVHNASFWLDLRVALFTLIFLFTGERRFEQAVREAKVLQKANGQPKTPADRNRPDLRELGVARGQSPARLPIAARARASQRQHRQARLP